MWPKYILIALLFYFLALLQTSFFAHFSLLGIIPNLVFIFFFLLAFFAHEENVSFLWRLLFFSVIAGFLLDIFYGYFLGFSVVLLFVLGFLAHRAHSMLLDSSGNFSAGYFTAIFLASFLIYQIILQPKIITDWKILPILLFNVLFALVGFFIFVKISQPGQNNRQLKLFR